jgi:hypothetical protein
VWTEPQIVLCHAQNSCRDLNSKRRKIAKAPDSLAADEEDEDEDEDVLPTAVMSARGALHTRHPAFVLLMSDSAEPSRATSPTPPHPSSASSTSRASRPLPRRVIQRSAADTTRLVDRSFSPAQPPTPEPSASGPSRPKPRPRPAYRGPATDQAIAPSLVATPSTP